MEKWLVAPPEIEKISWDIVRQTSRNFDWLVTETEATIRDWFK